MAAAVATNVWDLTNLSTFTNSVRRDLEENKDYVITNIDDELNLSIELAHLIWLSGKLIAGDNLTKYGEFIASLNVLSVLRVGSVKFSAIYSPIHI